MNVSIDGSILSVIQDHARTTYPEECCGALIGVADAGRHRVLDAIALENEAPTGREHAFVISAQQSLACSRLAAKLGLDVVGFYHSHPDHSPVPSQRDRELGWPSYCFVITGIDRDGVAATRAWQLHNDGSHFTELSLDIVPDAP